MEFSDTDLEGFLLSIAILLIWMNFEYFIRHKEHYFFNLHVNPD